MKVVIDTNVLVSALLRQGTPPAAVVEALLRGELTLLYDERILEEYRDVLARPKFGFASTNVDALLRFITSAGLLVPSAACPLVLPDPGDQPFADVAYTGGADALITGNAAHFPVKEALCVITPREWLDMDEGA